MTVFFIFEIFDVAREMINGVKNKSIVDFLLMPKWQQKISLRMSELGGIRMALENNLGITDSVELAREEERISKRKAVALFETGYLDTLQAGTFAHRLLGFIGISLQIFIHLQGSCGM